MKRTYRFKSIRVVPVKPVDDGSAAYGGPVDPEKERVKITYDIAGVRDHLLEAGPAHFLFCRSWIQSFFIALLAAVLVAGLAYGFMALVLAIDFSSPGGALAGRVYLLCMLLFFIAVLAGAGLPAAVRRLKWDLVVSERGPGAWKIVDAEKWDRFERMLRLAREREEKAAQH